jgi:hypothetical protein
LSVLLLHWRFQPALDIQNHPLFLGVFLHRPYQQILRDVIEEALAKSAIVCSSTPAAPWFAFTRLYASQTSPWKYRTALPHSSAPPIAGWLIESRLPDTTPWPPLPYSRPRGSSTCGFSVRIGAPGSHVPLNRLLASSGHLNAGCRPVHRQAPPELVWNLLLQAGSEGPSLINQAVTHMGPSSALCARGAQSSAYLVSWYPLRRISRSNGVRSMLLSKGETTPPCGVPRSDGNSRPLP